jgi:hypothetical protein
VLVEIPYFGALRTSTIGADSLHEIPLTGTFRQSIASRPARDSRASSDGTV